MIGKLRLEWALQIAAEEYWKWCQYKKPKSKKKKKKQK